MVRKLLALFFSGCFAVIVFAQQAAKPASGPKNSFCPSAKSLERKGLWWSAPGGWKSYSQSFVHDLKAFAGAQWVGVNFGSIICLYQGPLSATFPVTLQEKYHRIVPMPQGGKWGPYQQGHKDCVSADPTDCPYTVKEPKKIKDVFQNLQFFDKAAHQPNNQGDQ